MASSEGARAFKPELLHADLTEIFLRAEEAGLENLPTRYPRPPIVELGNGIVAANVGHSFIDNYFDLGGDKPGSAKTEITDAAGSEPNTYEARRQKRIRFLRAGQSFFELRVSHDKLQLYILGNPRFQGPGSLAVRFAEEVPASAGESERPDDIIFAPMINEHDNLPLPDKVGRDGARIARLCRQLLN